MPEQLGEKGSGHSGGLIVKAEEVCRVHGLLEDLLEDGEDCCRLLSLADPGSYEQESLLRNVLLPVVELARLDVHLC